MKWDHRNFQFKKKKRNDEKGKINTTLTYIIYDNDDPNIHCVCVNELDPN